jgi:hypothetical protein
MGALEWSEVSKTPYVAGVGRGGGPGRLRQPYQNARAEMMPRSTTPPTTPPAIAPVLDELLEDLVGEGEAEEEVEVEDEVTEEDEVGEGVVDVPKIVPVGIVVPVDSGALASSLAAAGLNPSPILTSRYAQPGTAVPEGMLLGKAR